MSKVNGYICFYADYVSNDFLSTDEQTFLQLEQIYATLESGILEYPKNIWGITDEQGHSLQFYVNADGSIEVNITVPEKFGSYTRHLEKQACYRLIRTAPRYLKEIDFTEFEFNAWWNEQ